MSLEKRPRSPVNYISDHIIVILSDDEDHPRKRQKSLTPSQNTVIKPLAKRIVSRPISIRSTPDPLSQPEDVSVTPKNITNKKTSPWRNQPSWQKQVLTTKNIPSVSRPSAKLFNNNSLQLSASAIQKELNGWTINDNNRLRGLSLSQGDRESPSLLSRNGAKPGHPPRSPSVRDSDEEREQILEKFKFGPATALRFNPKDGKILPPVAHKHHIQHPDGSNKNHTEPDTDTIYRPPRQPLFRDDLSGLQGTTSTGNISLVKAPTQLTTSKSLASAPSASTVTAKGSQPNLIPSTPHQSAKISINVPLSDSAKWKKERKALIEKLKQGTNYAENHPEEIESFLGLTGFSAEFHPIKDGRLEKAAQVKKRKVDRSRILLDMGERVITNPTSQPHIKFVHPSNQAKAILTARFAEPFQPPLTFSNTFNDRRLNGKFQFVSEYILRKGVKATGPIGQPGCDCSGQCNATSSCACLKKTFKAKNSKQEWSEQIQQYERRPDGLVVLRDDFIKRHMIHATDDNDDELQADIPQRVEISECNEHCGCDNSCINRVVQKGRTVPLEIFETERCGFGVRSLVNLVRGQFVEFYLGEVITDSELTRRENAAEAGSTSYIYSLDWFSSHQPYHIDGENFGSAMRFVNHSCDPNAGTFTVLNNKSTKQLHYVAFFTLKDIPAGTEITIDYTPQAVGETYELKAADEGMERCYCGAKNCRQMLWLPGKERKARKKTVNKSLDY